jgi:hypothetical protein
MKPVKYVRTPYAGQPKDGEPTPIHTRAFLEAWGQKACDGFYPLGVNGQWHGGVHFDAGTGEVFDQSDAAGVRCIADGEVVAYRYDDEPPYTKYSSFDNVKAWYSTSFVLVKHRLQLPEEHLKPQKGSQAAAGGKADSSPAAKQPDVSCFVFSLYMHLRHWKAYEKCPGIDRPQFWSSNIRVVKKGANHPAPTPKERHWKISRPPVGLKGVKIYYYPSETTGHDDRHFALATDVIGWIRHGTAFRLGNEVNITLNKKTIKAFRLLSVDDPNYDTAQFDNNQNESDTRLFLCDDPKSKDATITKAYLLEHGIVFESDKNLKTLFGSPEVKDGKVHVLKKPFPIKAGALIGHAGHYRRFCPEVIDHIQERWMLHLEMFAGSQLEKFIEDCRKMEENVAPYSKNLIKIEAGALPYQVANGPLSLETGKMFVLGEHKGAFVKLWRCNDQIVEKNKIPKDKSVYSAIQKNPTGEIVAEKLIDEFKNERTQAKKKNNNDELTALNAFGHTRIFTPEKNQGVWVLLEAFERFVQAYKLKNENQPFILDASFSGAWPEFPPRPPEGSDVEKKAAGMPMLIDIYDRTFKGIINSALDDNNPPRLWWEIQYETNATKEGKRSKALGWVCEKDFEKVSLHTPWGWPWFQLVKDEATPPGERYENKVKNIYLVTDKLHESLKKDFSDIDANHDNKLSLAELRSKWIQPDWALMLSRKIIQHGSEWGLEMDYWSQIDPCIEDAMKENKANTKGVDASEVWAKEKERIEKLRFWDCVKSVEDFPQDYTHIWHIHPLGFVDNFVKRCHSDICNVAFYHMKVSNGIFRVSHEVFDFILKTEKYMERPYVPSDDSSGVTLGYGYDLGQQKEETVRRELVGLYTSDEITRLLSALGKRGDDARNIVGSLSDIKISEDNALWLAIKMKHRYAQQVVDIYPEVIKFHPHCQGALLSMVINRGKSLKGDDRAEMREIQQDFRNDTPENIPERIEKSKRLWENKPNMKGVATRRVEEAKFFKKGLTCICFAE